jgi:hypothetical protein
VAIIYGAFNMKNLIFLCFIFCHNAIAKVTSVVRNPASTTQALFAYQGNRLLQADEVSSPQNEENVFIFSKLKKDAKPDVMYFQ